MTLTVPELGTSAFWRAADGEREEAFAALRGRRPLSFHDRVEFALGPADGPAAGGFWAVVGYDDVRRVSRDPATFCSGRGVMFADMPQEVIEATQSFIAMDAPRHTVLRALVSRAFTPKRIGQLEHRMHELSRDIVADAAPSGGGDFVEMIAKRLPEEMICEMIGVEAADRGRVAEAANTAVGLSDPEVLGGRDPMTALASAIGTLYEIATRIARDRREHPRDDVMTALVEAEIDDLRLSEAEIASFFVLLSGAGNDTTRHTTSHAMRALCEFPDQRRWLMQDLAGRIGGAVDEFVRWATPVQSFRRTVTAPVELHGELLQPGAKVMLFYCSANRDGAAFDAPEEFNLARSPNRHLGFGGGGPHYCLGAPLARAQLRTIFTEMLTRLPDIDVGEPETLGSPFVRGVKRMTCQFTPRDAAPSHRRHGATG